MKNRKRESCTSGTVRDEDGNILIYSARPPQRLEGFVMPSFKNLHICRLVRRCKEKPSSITLSARLRRVGGTETSIGCRSEVARQTIRNSRLLLM
jgi:hypothetical protein